jgi:hypothetical protein
MIVKTSIINYTYLYFFFTSLAIFLYALVIIMGGQDGMVVFTFFNRFISVDRFQLSILFKVAYLVLALGYYFADRLKLNLNKKATVVHTYITIGAVLLNALVIFVNGYFIDDFSLAYKANEMISVWCVTVALLVQPLFFWNLFQAVSKRNI